MQIQSDECYCEVFYCFPAYKWLKLKWFLTAGRFWATGEVTASRMATTATSQEIMLQQKAAPIPSFRGRTHRCESLHLTGLIHTLFLGRPHFASPGWRVSSETVWKDTSSLSKKTGKGGCQVPMWPAKMTPRNLDLEPREAARWPYVWASSASELLDNYVKMPVLSCLNSMTSSLPSPQPRPTAFPSSSKGSCFIEKMPL